MIPESFLTSSLSSAESLMRPRWHIGASLGCAYKPIAWRAICLRPFPLTLHLSVITFAAMGMGSPETARKGLMTPTAQHGGRNLSAAGRLFFALRHGNSFDGLSHCVSGRRHRGRASAWLQSRLRAPAGHLVPLRNAVRERLRLDRDGDAGRLFCLQGRHHPALATLSDHRHSGRLYHVLDVLARCGLAI